MIENLQKQDRPDLIPHGTLYTFETEMVPYPDHRRRTIRVWLPEEYDGVRRFPVIYLHDGHTVFRGPEGRRALEADRALTALSAEGISAIVVAIDTARTRSSELTPPYPLMGGDRSVNGIPIPKMLEESTTELYASFMIHHLKPMIDETFLTLADPLNTCVGGCSAGGTTSYFLFLHYPEVFGKALCNSPGFPMFRKDKLMEELDGYDYSRIEGHRICFYNGDQGIDASSIYDVIDIYRKLREKGLDATRCMALIDTRQTHYEAPWSIYLPEMLRFLFAEDNRAEFPPERPPMG